MSKEQKNKKRLHGPGAAGAGDLGRIHIAADPLGLCPSCAADLTVGQAIDLRTGRIGRVIMHPLPFCTYYGETDPETIERDVRRAQEAS